MKTTCGACGAPMHPTETSLDPQVTNEVPSGPSFDEMCLNDECEESVPSPEVVSFST